MSPAEIAAVLHGAGVTTRPWLTKSPSRVIADLLAHQVRAGRVVKVGPARFAVVPASMSRSTRQRCLRWRREEERQAAEIAAWRAAYPPCGVGSPISDDAPGDGGALFFRALHGARSTGCAAGGGRYPVGSPLSDAAGRPADESSEGNEGNEGDPKQG